MNASFNNHLECRYYLRLDLLRLIKVMLFTLTLIWIVNIVVLITSPTVSTKSIPCFTDGDCPSALDKCFYGSWKGLGTCRRVTRETEGEGDLRRSVRSDARNIFTNRRLVRRKRNPSNIWNDSYLSQKRWDVWQPAGQHNKAANQLSNAAFRQRDTNDQFDDIAADLLKFGRSYITFKGINYTVCVIPATVGASDWLVTLAKDDFDADKNQTKHIMQESHTTNEGIILRNDEHTPTDTKTEVASILLENSFQNSANADAVVNISVRYPINALSRRRYRGGSDIRLRFRRQLPVRLMKFKSIDPLINHVTQVKPVIPSAEDVFGKNIGKRSIYSKQEMQRIRRELEEIEDDVAPLPKVIRGPDEGPIIIEDLFKDSKRSSTLRKRRHHEAGSTDDSMHNRVTRRKRHHTSKEKAKAISFTNADSSRVSGGSQPRKKRKLSRSVSLLGSNKKVRSDHRVKKPPRAAVKQGVKKPVFNSKVAKRSQINTGKTARKIVPVEHSKDIKRSDEDALGGNTLNSGTTDAPDPFASLKNTKEPHIDYYDVSKRNPLRDEEDVDPESSLDEDDSEIDNDEEEETRRKRQTLAEELEDEDEPDIPSWRETVELMRRANTFAVPAHDSTGHVVLVRRVRDLGALDLGESLVKLRETMAKIFGRCSPARRRKRSHQAPAPPEVVTDQLSNEETWEIHGEGNEVVDQAKIDVHMDDDKPYNVTTVLRPMGKRSYNYDHKNEEANTLQHTKMALHSGLSRGMRDILDQSARLDQIPHLKGLVNIPQTPGLKNIKRFAGSNERSAYSKRNEQDIPLDKDVHMQAQEGSPVDVELIIDQQPGSAQPVAEVSSNTLSASQSQNALSKRSQYQQSPFASPAVFSKTGQSSTHLMSSRNPSPSLRGSHLSYQNEAGGAINKVRRGPHEKCISCKTLSRSALNMAPDDHTGRKTVREPYVITRKYNDSKTRSARDEDSGRKARELSDTSGLDRAKLGDTGGLDRANLLYLADGDPLPSSWRAPLVNIKRDVDISVEVEDAGNDTDSDKSTEKTTTVLPPSTVIVKIEEEKDDDVFSVKSSDERGKKTSSIEATASVTSERKGANPSRRSSIILDDNFSSYPPVKTRVLNLSPPRPKSVLMVEKGDRSPAIEETITSGDLEWGLSGSSDRLMTLISGIEKALRVPLGSSDSGPGQIAVLDDSSNLVQTQVISSQPEIVEQKNRYLYSVNEPQPPLVVTTSTQERKPDVVEMDVTTGTGAITTNVGDLNENIYLKGFDVPRKPAKPLFVDAAAKKMMWVDPSYKTVVSSGFPKYKMPPSYVRLYNGGLPHIMPIDQWAQVANIQNLDSDTVEDVRIGNNKQVTVEKFADQPSGTAITDIRASKTTEILQPPRLLGVQKNIVLNDQLIDNPPPEKYKDTLVKVVSSLRSDDSESAKAAVLNTSPSMVVHVDGQDDDSGIIQSNNFPSNIRILHRGIDSDGKIVASIGSKSNFKHKKDLEEVSDASSIPLKRSRLLSANGVVLADNKLNTLTKGLASMQAQGDKRNVQHVYRATNSGKRESLKRRINTKSATLTSKRANADPAQPAPVVHTYSKDPGVQGATMGMMKDLASQLASQNAQRNPQALSRRQTACAAGSENCRRKKLTQRSVAPSAKSHNYNTPAKSQQVSGSEMMSNRQIKKRDVSRTIFEQPKVFVVGPKTIFEAPGTRYNFIDSQERNNTIKHLQIYTVSNISTNVGNEVPVEKPSVSDDSSSDDDEQFDHDSASSLPMSHEKALQEAEGKERYKIVDSVEGFSIEAPVFDNKVTSGGQISEDRMVPVPLEINRSEIPHDENRISITADVEPHEHKPGLKFSATEIADSGSSATTSQQKTQTVEYVDSAQTSPDSHERTTKVIQSTDSNSTPNTRKKRRSPNTGTGHRRSREEKIQVLRSELQNLNNVGSKLGLHFFDKSSIDRIVREVSGQERQERSKKETLTKRRSKMVNTNQKRKRKTKKTIIDSKMEKNSPVPFQTGYKRNVGERRTKHAFGLHDKYAQLGETISSKSIEGQGNAKQFAHAKRKLNDHTAISGHDRERNVFKRNRDDLSFRRTMRYSNKPPKDEEIDSENDADTSAPSYHYSNAVKNDYPLVISNPENQDTSNNRLREETLKISNKESDPMEITAILRGRRKKREIKPNEFFRFSREGPLYRRSAGSGMTAPLNPALTGQWQKQLVPARIHRGEDRSKSNEATPLVQNTQFGKSNQRSSGLQNVPNSPRAAFSRRPEQQISDKNYPQWTPNAEIKERKQFVNAFPPQKKIGLQGRQRDKEPLKITKNTDNKDTAGNGKKDMLNKDITKKTINQGSLQTVKNERNGPKETLPKTSNTTKQEPPATPRKSKGPEIGVWKKLGEIFDIGPKETAKPEAGTTVPPTSSPDPLQAMVPGEETIPAAPILGGKPDERDGMRKPPEQSTKPESREERDKSSLRAAIVDRLLQDLRKMASARGSEMARAESDLIEILHDYQTDLVDEDEKTIAGEPFQGVRIHDNVVIPVVYQAVPIKMESLSQHRLVVRSSDQRSSRDRRRRSSWDNAPFNPP